MPNTGMLDHSAFRPGSETRRKSLVHWMQPWPSTNGYQTVRQTHRINTFSRYFQNQIQVDQLCFEGHGSGLMDERVVNFTVEAEQSLKEVSYAVKDGALSSSLKSSGEVAYFNLTTREGSQFTVRLCMRGFQVDQAQPSVSEWNERRYGKQFEEFNNVVYMNQCSQQLQVVGHSYDNVELEETDEVGSKENTEPVFETVYALLNHLSPSYQTTFNSAVSDKLNQFSES